MVADGLKSVNGMMLLPCMTFSYPRLMNGNDEERVGLERGRQRLIRVVISWAFATIPIDIIVLMQQGFVARVPVRVGLTVILFWAMFAGYSWARYLLGIFALLAGVVAIYAALGAATWMLLFALPMFIIAWMLLGDPAIDEYLGSIRR